MDPLGRTPTQDCYTLMERAETGSPLPSLHPLCPGNIVGMIEGCKMVWMIDMSGVQWGMLGNIFQHVQGVKVSRASQTREALSHIITVSILHFKEYTTYCLRLLTATST